MLPEAPVQPEASPSLPGASPSLPEAQIAQVEPPVLPEATQFEPEAPICVPEKSAPAVIADQPGSLPVKMVSSLPEASHQQEEKPQVPKETAATPLEQEPPVKKDPGLPKSPPAVTNIRPASDSLIGSLFGIPVPPEKYSGLMSAGGNSEERTVKGNYTLQVCFRCHAA